MSISITYLNQGLKLLNELSKYEYKIPLQDVLSDSDQMSAFKRVGRLMGVWPKKPFADPFPYEPERRNNWAFNATITVLSDINNAPTAGDNNMPNGARTPAANGMAMML